jgi:hypothetical protein
MPLLGTNQTESSPLLTSIQKLVPTRRRWKPSSRFAQISHNGLKTCKPGLLRSQPNLAEGQNLDNHDSKFFDLFSLFFLQGPKIYITRLDFVRLYIIRPQLGDQGMLYRHKFPAVFCTIQTQGPMLMLDGSAAAFRVLVVTNLVMNLEMDVFQWGEDCKISNIVLR